MKTHLFLLGSFYPNPSANGNCIENICNELIKKGDKILLICENNNLLKEKIIKKKGITIYLIKPRHYILLKYGINKKNYNLYNKLSAFNSIFHFITWPLTSLSVARNFEKKAIELIDSFDIDNIVCVFNPYETLNVGKNLKRMYKSKRIIFYFLDAFFYGKKPIWMLNSFYKIKINTISKKFRYIDKFVFMKNHKLPKKFYDTYFSKIEILDIPLIKKDLYINSNYVSLNKTKLIYAGNFVNNLREPYFFLDCIEKLKNYFEDFEVHIYGENATFNIEKRYEKMIKDKVLFLHGKISHEEAIKQTMKADILVNIGSNNSNFIPSKIFEYISTGKPIINFSDIDDDPSIKYFEKYKNYISISKSDNINLISKKIIPFIKNNGKQEQTLTKDEIYGAFYENTPSPFINKVLYEGDDYYK